MSDVEWEFVQTLESAEAMALVDGVSVVLDVERAWGDHIVFNFDLPDGRMVEYTAKQESDYYGGYYMEISWALYRRVDGATDSAPVSETGGSEFESRSAHGVSADDQQNRGDDGFNQPANHASEGRTDSESLAGSPRAITASASRLPVENRDSGITSTDEAK